MNKLSKRIALACSLCFSTAFADPFSNLFEASPFTAEDPAYIDEKNDYSGENEHIYSDNEPTTQHSYIASSQSHRDNTLSVTVLPKGADIFDEALKSYSDKSVSDVDLSLAKIKTQRIQQEYNAQVTWEIDAGFTHTRNSDHSLSTVKHNNDVVLKTGVELQKTLWDKELDYSIKSSQQNIQTAKITQFSEQQSLIKSVALAYLEYHAAKDMEAVAQRRYNLLTQIQYQIIRKEKMGFAANIDVSKVEDKVQTANISLLTAQTNLQKASINLRQLTDGDSTQYQNSPSLFNRKNIIRLKSSDFLINTALSNNTDLKALQSEQLSLRKAIQSKRHGATPKFGFLTSLSQAWKEGDSDQNSFDFAIGVNMKMPLYTGGRINNQIEQAKLKLLRTERRTNSKKRDIITQINILTTEFSGSLSSYKSLLKLQKHKNKDIKLVKAAVPYGVRNNRDVYNALDDKFQLENALIRQYYDLLKIKVKIMKLTGELNLNDLSQLRNLLFSV